MSCITEIIKRKADKPYLITPGFAIEDGGVYKNYEYLITFTAMGHRCGYVAIPETSKLYNKDIMLWDGDLDDRMPNFDVHGSVTFWDHATHIINETIGDHHCTDKWIGFDAAHWDDRADYSRVKEVWPSSQMYEEACAVERIRSHQKSLPYGTIKTCQYMKSECLSLIDQVIVHEVLAGVSL